jgi:hypothetical protein
MKTMMLVLGAVIIALASCGKDVAPPPAPVTVDTAPTPLGIPSELAFARKPRPSTFVEASPDTRSHADLAIAACSGAPDAQHPDGWRCAGKKPVTFAASTGGTPIIPTSWTVPNWFVNKTTGSDTNDCITSLTACKTKQEIWVHRLGAAVGTCPRFQQTTTIEQDVSDTDNTDPLYPCSSLEKSGSLIIKGGPVTGTAATFTRSAAKSTTVGTNSLLAGSFSAGTPAAGVMVVNTTALKSSRAWIYKTAGGANWNLSQPLAPLTLPTTNFVSAEIDTWNTGDTVTLVTPIAINIPAASSLVGDDASATAALYLYNMTIFDPNGVGADIGVIGAGVQLVECASQRELSYGSFVQNNAGGGLGSVLANVSELASVTFAEGGSLGTMVFLGGIVGTSSQLFAPDFDNDVITHGLFLTSGYAAGAAGGNGNYFLDGSITVRSGLAWQIAGVVYGASTNTIKMQGTSHFWNGTGSNFQTTFTAPGLVTGIQLNGGVSVSCHTNADPDVFHTATTTPAHLDAACGAGTGLGSNGFQIGGASVANF